MKKIYYLIAMAFMAITFTSCENVPDPYGKPVSPIIPYEPAGTGVETDPFNVAGAIEKCKKIGTKASTEKYYIKGYVAVAAEAVSGKIEFTMTDSKEGKGKKFTAYRVAGSDNKSLPSDFAVSIGEEIVIYGPIYHYNSKTPETATGAYIVTVNGEKTGGGGSTPTGQYGTKDAPITVAKAIEVINGLSDNASISEDAFVKGTVVSVGYYDSNHKSLSYYISDDGTATNQVQIYSGKGLDGADFNAKTELNPGAVVVVQGVLKKYVKEGKMTPEIDMGSKIVSITNNSGSDTPPATDEGSLDAPKTIAQALAAIDALAEGAKTDAKYFVKGKVAKITTDASKIGSQYTDINYYISEDGSVTNALYIYRGKNLNNTNFTSADQLAEGDEVIVYGQLQKYKNSNTGYITPQMAQGSYLVKTSNPNASSSGGGSGTGGGGEAVTSLTNGGFETWAEGIPTGWKSASTASSATLEQSTDAHTGNYAVLVKGGGTQNKRLASQEITLTAGTYIFSFWVKATTANKAQCCMGYVPVTNGTAGTYQYKKEGGSQVYETLSTTWSQVTYEFTLEADATICLVAMNPKAGSYSSGEDILVDDATLTKK
jgi:hypothetical protein